MISTRLQELIEFKNITVYQFEKEIGAGKNSISLPIKNGKTVGSELLGKIFTRYPEVNLEWLITGHGSMLRDTATIVHDSLSPEKTKMTTSQALTQEQPGSIAFYGDIDVTAGPDTLFTDGSTRPSDFIHVPSFEDCEVAFPMWGDSMWPTYESGQVILCKEFHDWRYYVPYGEVFLIITDSLRTVKYVKKASNEQNLLLVSKNSHYEPFELPKDRIRRMFFVKGSVKRNMI